MKTIAILSSSVRRGRRSHRVALYLDRFLRENYDVKTDIIDLDEYDFPLFEERLKYTENPTAEMEDYTKRLNNADGVIIVTPEYNGGYPASLKNALDFHYDEWRRKPVAIATVSNGIFGGSQVITSLQFVLWKMKAWTVPAMFPTLKVSSSYDENGVPADAEGTEKRAKAFIDELMWCVEAKTRMEQPATVA